ncbi:MAG: Zn-dependent alcohol dehydrogenase [Alphaproteobacteria bacterium]
MRAAVYVGQGQPVSIEDVTPSPPGPGDVVVEVGASGVCHSDLSVVNGYLRMPEGVVLGHEAAGRVVEVGRDVTRVHKGDRVIASFVPACGTCWFCERDQSNLCELEAPASAAPRGVRSDGSAYLAFTGLGTFAEAFTASEHSVVRVDTDLPDEQLALIGCGVTTGLGAALNTARIEPGSKVAVVGCGGVGQSIVQGARIAGAARIVAVDTVAMKREQALAFGATDAIDPSGGDAAKQVRRLAGGRGVDFAFEAVGLPDTIRDAWAMARKGGTVVVVGMSRVDAQVTLPAFGLFYDEKRILGSKYGSAHVRRDFQRFVGLIEAGRLDVGAMVSRRIRLDEVNEAFHAMEAGQVIRSVIA